MLRLNRRNLLTSERDCADLAALEPKWYRQGVVVITLGDPTDRILPANRSDLRSSKVNDVKRGNLVALTGRKRAIGLAGRRERLWARAGEAGRSERRTVTVRIQGCNRLWPARVLTSYAGVSW